LHGIGRYRAQEPLSLDVPETNESEGEHGRERQRHDERVSEQFGKKGGGAGSSHRLAEGAHASRADKAMAANDGTIITKIGVANFADRRRCGAGMILAAVLGDYLDRGLEQVRNPLGKKSLLRVFAIFSHAGAHVL
jgi:hypothetical protein